MAKKVEFPQWTLLTETWSLELEKDSFTEQMAMIRVNQVKVLLVSNIGGTGFDRQLIVPEHLSTVGQGKCANNY